MCTQIACIYLTRKDLPWVGSATQGTIAEQTVPALLSAWVVTFACIAVTFWIWATARFCNIYVVLFHAIGGCRNLRVQGWVQHFFSCPLLFATLADFRSDSHFLSLWSFTGLFFFLLLFCKDIVIIFKREVTALSSVLLVRAKETDIRLFIGENSAWHFFNPCCCNAYSRRPQHQPALYSSIHLFLLRENGRQQWTHHLLWHWKDKDRDTNSGGCPNRSCRRTSQNWQPQLLVLRFAFTLEMQQDFTSSLQGNMTSNFCYLFMLQEEKMWVLCLCVYVHHRLSLRNHNLNFKLSRTDSLMFIQLYLRQIGEFSH